jgi:hypothetical protein
MSLLSPSIWSYLCSICVLLTTFVIKHQSVVGRTPLSLDPEIRSQPIDGASGKTPVKGMNISIEKYGQLSSVLCCVHCMN